MARQQINNQFTGGLITDSNEYLTPNSVLTDANNATLITHTGNEVIIQNEKGTTHVTSVKPNYVVLAAKSYNGVAYIISGERLNGKLTGRGEIGSYPSPDYSDTSPYDCLDSNDLSTCSFKTKLVDKYAPFMNYTGDSGNTLGEFNSINFNFQDDQFVEIVAVQPSYDNSVNVIFTDFYNKPKLINSRFSVQTNNEVLIINRTGTNDDNIYTLLDWDTKLNHILSTNKLPVIKYDGWGSGKLPTGTYTYYMQYVTQDGNTTDIIAQSFMCPVLLGDSLKTIRSSVRNDPTDKSNKLIIDNIDPSYYGIKLYFTYSSGDSSADPNAQAFAIDQTYLISNNTSISINHTGFETSNQVDPLLLLSDNNTVYTYRTGAELQGRLFIGNIKQRNFNYNELRAYAASIKPFAVETTIELPFTNDGSNSDLSELTSTQLKGYYNPINVHDKLGYWPGEIYLFSVEFFFKDGSRSPLFPTRGNFSGSYNSLPISSDTNYDSNWDNNTLGTLKIPKRTLPILANGKASIMGVRFEVPTIPTSLEGDVIGLRFHRSIKRKQNIIAQGIILNTLLIPLNEYTGKYTEQPQLSEYADKDEEGLSTGYLDSNSKFIIAPEFCLETTGIYKADNNQILQGSRERILDELFKPGGLDSVRYLGKLFNLTKANINGANGYKTAINKHYGFISPEIIANEIESSSKLAGSGLTMEIVGENNFQYCSPSFNTQSSLKSGNLDELGYFSCYKNVYTRTTSTNQTHKVDSDFVYSNTSFASRLLFSSKCEFVSKQRMEKDEFKYPYHSLTYNSYVGLRTLDNTSELLTDFDENYWMVADSTYATDPNFYRSGKFVNYKNNVDRYGNLTYNIQRYVTKVPEQPTSVAVSNLRNDTFMAKTVNLTKNIADIVWAKDIKPEYETYTPISQWSYINTASRDLVQASATLSQVHNNFTVFYNGDNYVQTCFRKIYYNSLDLLVVDDNVARSVNVGPVITFVCDGNSNLAFRKEQIVDISEGTRSWYPRIGGTTPSKQIDLKGTNDPFRTQYRLPESQGYDSSAESNSTALGKWYKTLSASLPFIQNSFSTRIQFSDLFVQKNFQNGYRFFPSQGYKDYSAHTGDIVKIVSYQGSGLLVVFEHGTALLPISQRIAGLQDQGSQVYFEATSILPPTNAINYVSELYGSRWQGSVVSSDNTVYGVDIDKSKIWRFEGSQLNLVSDYKVQKVLRELAPLYFNKKHIYLRDQVNSYFDPFKQNIIFTFLNGVKCGEETVSTPACCDDSPATIAGNNVTLPPVIPASQIIQDVYCPNGKVIVFNEQPTNQWITFHSFVPYNMWFTRDKLYSVNVKENNNYIWNHYSNDKYSFYYDNQEEFSIEFVATADTSVQQIFDNLIVISNHQYPVRIEYTTDSGTFIQTMRPRNVIGIASTPFKQNPQNNIFMYDAVYKEDRMFISVVKDNSDTRTLENITNRRIRDKYCKIKVVYKTSDKVFIKNIITAVTISYA